MNIAITMAMTKLKRLRNRVNFFPSSLISRGRVRNPTMVRVVMKAAAIMMPAPLSIKDAVRGNATMAGINSIAPNPPAINTPVNPEFSPKIVDIISFDKNPCIIPMHRIMIIT